MLAWHVDYWDRLGWKDTFGSKRWTARQRAYSKALGMRQIGTPFFYVDNRFVRNHQIAGAVDHASRKPVRLRIDLDVKASKGRAKVMAKLAAKEAPREGTHVFAVLFAKRIATRCDAGENRGKTLDEVFVVLDAAKPVPYGETYAHEFALPKGAKELGVALLVEDPKTMSTIACAQAAVRE